MTSWRSAILVADMPLFTIVGAIVGSVLGENLAGTGNKGPLSALGATVGALSFFCISLLPAIRLALQEHRTAKMMAKDTAPPPSASKDPIILRNTLFPHKPKGDD